MRNMNDDRPDKVFAKLIRDNLLTFQDTIFESRKQQDNIAVWLVGMSTGSIALIISQFSKLNPDIYIYLKYGILFLTATIICGLVFRILHLFLQDRDRNDHIYIINWLSGYSQPSLEIPLELPEDATPQYIASSIFRYMGLDMTPEYYTYIETENNIEYWRKEYEQFTADRLALKKAENQMIVDMANEYFELHTNLEGLPPHTFEQATQIYNNTSLGIKKRRLRKSCNMCYILMCISFALSVLIISSGFIITDYKGSDTSATEVQKQTSPTDQIKPLQINKTD